MWPFKEKKVLDLTGSVPKTRIIRSNASDSEYKDMTANSSGESALGFLGSMATSASSDNLNSAGESRDSPQHLKVKVEDVEYKIESLRRRIDAVFDRLDLAEKKINRLEGR